MVSKEDHETYRALVYTLCDRFMIAADPVTVTIRVNINGIKYKYAVISVALIGFHINLHDRCGRHISKTFLTSINSTLEYMLSL